MMYFITNLFLEGIIIMFFRKCLSWIFSGIVIRLARGFRLVCRAITVLRAAFSNRWFAVVGSLAGRMYRPRRRRLMC